MSAVNRGDSSSKSQIADKVDCYKGNQREIRVFVGLRKTLCLQLTLNCAGDVIAQKPRSGQILRLCPGIGMELRTIRPLVVLNDHLLGSTRRFTANSNNKG